MKKWLRIVIALAVVVVAAGAYWLFLRPKSKGTSAQTYQTAAVTRGQSHRYCRGCR